MSAMAAAYAAVSNARSRGKQVAYDLVIRGGTVVDGTGAPGYRADVAVTGDRIVAVGRVDGKGATEVDAEGHAVTPGFIDGHTHMDAQVSWDPLGTCSCWHGVTTAVMGNCGFTLAPARPDGRHLVVRNLERAEDISADAMAAGIEWRWETFPQYLDAVDALPKGINYAGYIGHSALRTWAMGERAFEEEAGDDDLDLMERQVADAMAAGAVGFTTSRSTEHQTADDRPVASRLASWHEVERLVGTVGRSGKGVFELALDRRCWSPDPDERAAELGRLRDLAVDTGVPVTFGVVSVAWRDNGPILKAVEETNAAGGAMFGQSHCREFLLISSFRTRLGFDVLPEWQEIRSQPLDAQRTLLGDPDVRARLVHAAHHGRYLPTVGPEAPKPDYERTRVLDRALPPNPTVAELARERGVDPVEVMIDLALASDFQQLFAQVVDQDTNDLLALLRHPKMVMTFTDSGAHVSQILDSSLPTHLLGYWVRERQAFTLEEGVRMLTSVPSEAWGFDSRGVIAEGMIADLNVFDPAAIAPELPVVDADLPGGAKRLKQKAAGFRATIVAGTPLLLDQEHTGALPGRLLRS
jgi:N-acyl-D-aspartate/D-glutamate deacylase